MKRAIERMDVFTVQMPLAGSYTSAGITKQAMKCVVTRLVASDGAVGISSIEPSAAAKSPGTAVEIAATLRKHVASAVVGMDPLNIHRLLELCDSLAPTQPGAGAAVEMAGVELAARINGVPVHTYLGGAVAERVQFNGWIGALPAGEAAKEAKRWLAAGFRSAKIKVGGGIEARRIRIHQLPPPACIAGRNARTDGAARRIGYALHQREVVAFEAMLLEQLASRRMCLL